MSNISPTWHLAPTEIKNPELLNFVNKPFFPKDVINKYLSEVRYGIKPRIVPIGSALTINNIHDGYELITIKRNWFNPPYAATHIKRGSKEVALFPGGFRQLYNILRLNNIVIKNTDYILLNHLKSATGILNRLTNYSKIYNFSDGKFDFPHFPHRTMLETMIDCGAVMEKLIHHDEIEPEENLEQLRPIANLLKITLQQQLQRKSRIIGAPQVKSETIRKPKTPRDNNMGFGFEM